MAGAARGRGDPGLDRGAGVRHALGAGRGVGTRLALRSAVASSARYDRLSRPIRTDPPGREFLWQADASDDKLKLMMRRERGAPLEPVLDPNMWAPEEALVFAEPSPDGALVAFAKAFGSTHGGRIHLLEVETGELLPDRPRGTFHLWGTWAGDQTPPGSSMRRPPSQVRCQLTRRRAGFYEHRIGSTKPARRVFGDDHMKEHWCSVEVSECGRFAVLYKWRFVHANAVYLLRLADHALIAVAPELQSVNHVQVIGDSLLIQTDLDAPRGRACIAPLTAPTEWRTLIPETSDALQTITGVGGRIYAVYSHTAAHRVRIHAEDGTYLRELELPALGSVGHRYETAASAAPGPPTTSGSTSRPTCSRRRSTATTTPPTG